MGGIAPAGVDVNAAVQPGQQRKAVCFLLLVLGNEGQNLFFQGHFFFSTFSLVPSGRTM